LKRRLAAILAADVVGFTRLMGANEAGTHQRLTELRQRHLEPLIAQHRGRLFKLMGDGFLVEFASVVDALACAVDWQNTVAEHEAIATEESRLIFRIGINLGDIIAEGDDLHGDGVNIAARLEGLAEAGGICLSEGTYRQVKGKLDIAFEDLGEQQLKNVAEPVRVFRVASADPVAEETPIIKERPSGPSKPSIAVLPFEDIGGAPGQTDFGEGLAADIITEFSRIGNISVVGRHESQNPALKGATAEAVGKRLSVGYILSGTIRRAGEQVRITAELLEVRTGHPRWSERYDRSLQDAFAVQDEIARAIVGIAEPILHVAEMDRIEQSSSKDLQIHELMLRAWRLSDKGSKEGNVIAQRDCEDAIALDPRYSDAHTQLAWILWYSVMNGWTDDPVGTLRRAFDSAETGWSLNPKDYDAVGARGTCSIGLGKYEAAARIVEELAKKFPDHAHATMYQGDLLTSLGRHDEALVLIDQAMRINPEHDHWPWMFKGICLFCLEQFRGAIEALETFKASAKFPFVRLVLAAAYVAAGRDEEARTELAPLRGDADILAARSSLIFRQAADRERLAFWVSKAAHLQ
jgi:class 3 adenylate cyclase/TolB-like protein/tetratricopeptide (TPR) repeat protein